MRKLTILAATAAALFMTVMPSHAASTQNRLSSAEVSEGWLLLFDGSTTFGWAPRDNAKWVAANGTLTPVVGSGTGVLSTTTEFANYQLKADVWIDEVANSGIFLRCPTSGSITGVNAYEVNVFDRHPSWPSGSIHSVARAVGKPSTVGRWSTYEVTADGRNLSVRINGHTVLNTRDDSHARGTVGLQYNGLGEVAFRNVKLRPLSLKPIFNGKDLTGWTGDEKLWKVENGEIVGTSPGIKKNSFLVSDLMLGNFDLTLEAKLTPNKENSGVQFRSEPLPDGEMRGYQADMGAGWWGKLYEESGRGLLWKESGERHVNREGWNTYRIRTTSDHIETWPNGEKCVDLKDPEGARKGVVGLQIHSGGPMEIRFRNFRLTVEPQEVAAGR